MSTHLQTTIDAAIEAEKHGALTLEEIRALLSKFADHIGIEPIELDEHHQADFIIRINVERDAFVNLVFVPELNAFVVSMVLSDVEQIPIPALKHILAANLSWDKTQGGVLGVPPGTDVLCFSRQLPVVELTAEIMDTQIAGLVEVGTAWQKLIESFLDAEGEATSAPELVDSSTLL